MIFYSSNGGFGKDHGSSDEEGAVSAASQLLDHAQQAIEQHYYDQALTILATLRDEHLPTRIKARHRYLYGWTLTELRRSQAALDELNLALRLAEQARDYELTARVRNRIGINYYQLLHFSAADDHFVKCWSAIYDHEINDISFKMHIYNNLGNTALRVGNFDAATDFYKSALTYASNLNESKWVGSICLGLGLACMHIGDYGEAIRAIKIGLELEQVVVGTSFLAQLSGMYGMILIKLNQPQAAVRELLKTIELCKQEGNSATLVIAYGNLAEALMDQGQLDEALAMGQRAVSEAQRLHLDDLSVAQLLHTLAKVHSRRSERELADRIFAQAEVLLRESGDTVKLSRLLSDYGHSLISWQDFDQAAEKLSEATLILNPKLKRHAML